MAFEFKTVGQEIAVWHLLSNQYVTNINSAFFNAVKNGQQVELNDGYVRLIEHQSNEYSGDSHLVFEYSGETYRMDVDEYDSWDEDSSVSEPYPVIPVPVNEVQYVRRR